MPVEFAIGAYRFGHSMIRDNYWLSFKRPGASLGEVFEFNRNPHLPVSSKNIVDFNAFFETGVNVPVFNKARKIDSALANGLQHRPGMTGLMAMLATRNLLRGAALGLPGGQGAAAHFQGPRLTANQLVQGLPASEVAILQSQNKLLMRKTPLWYYVLRDATALENGEQLGPLGAKIIARTFVQMLKRDADSFLHAAGGSTPFLPSAKTNAFTLQIS